MKLLHIDSSALGDHSTSRRLTAETVTAIRHRVPSVQVSYRDLDRDAPSHLTGASLAAQGAERSTLTGTLLADVTYGETLMAEFLAADVVVVGAPMYNFSIPTPLKAWIDRIVKAGVTFKYGENGVVGLAAGKQVVIVSSRGGQYPEGAAIDHQEAYLRGVFGFIGVTDVSVIRADGLAMGPTFVEQGLAKARAAIAASTTGAEPVKLAA
jgi:FMN-dependent NADH-azoreductase